jgi:M6 family metalloprotease-like protein
MKLAKVLALSLIIAVLLGTPSATAQINLANIGFYPSVEVGAKYEVELGLTAPKNISITAYLQGSRSERIKGSVKLNSGSLRNGKWSLIFNIPEKARTGKYAIFIKATSGSSVFIDQSRKVTVQKKIIESKPSTTPSVGFDVATMDHLESLPTFVYGLRKSCEPSSGECPTLTPELSLENQNECKIKDATYPNDSNYYVSSAFTTPPYSLAGKSEVTLSWIPVSFKDRPLPDKLYQAAIKTASEAEGFYEFNSYGRVNFSFSVPTKDSWINLPNNVKFYENLWASMNTQQVEQYLIERAGANGASLSDVITFIFPEGSYSITKNSSYDRDLKHKLKDGFIPSARVYGIHDRIEGIGTNGFTHGIGHAMYSFEDLYIFGGNSASGKNEQPGNGWDVMIGGGEFFLWQKWHIGWLKDDEVNCVTSSTEPKTLYLEPFQSSTGKKLIVIKVNSSKVVLAEYRTNTAKSILKDYNVCQKGGVSGCSSKYMHSGLLIYDLDTTRGHGAGPFKVSKNDKEKLIEVGGSLTYEGHKFEVLGSDGLGIYIRVSKI